LDVLSVEEHAQTRLMRAHGDLLGAQRLLLRGIARGLGHRISARAAMRPWRTSSASCR
jgi:hypothetical protein